MSVEEDKIDDIGDEDMHYDGEGKKNRITSRENAGTGVEQSQPSMEGEPYNSVSKQLQFLMNNYTFM